MKKWIYLLMTLLIIGDVFVFVESSDIRIGIILLLYLYLVGKFCLKSTQTFLFALFLMLVSFVQFLFITPDILVSTTVALPPERTAVWTYLFLVIGAMQKWREYKKNI